MQENWLSTRLMEYNLSPVIADIVSVGIFFIVVSLVALLLTLFLRKTLLVTLANWINKSNYTWDNKLIHHGFFTKISWAVPLAIFSVALDAGLNHDSAAYILIRRLIMTGFVIVSIFSLNALLSSLNDIHRMLRKTRAHALQGYIDAGKILIYVLGIIFIISIFTGKSPLGILSILGGLTAITMLVFKDTILGFVASIQLGAGDMVRIGDWIEMAQYGADGDVIEMSIHSIRVQNWDKTITTIPTYSLVSSSFKNWRGMNESGGRRIKRSLTIDVNSITFCDDAMLEKFAGFSLLDDYLKQKKQEIDVHNKQQKTIDKTPVNGRHQTNIGVFRAYIQAYLRSNPNIHQGMTFLVRQLPSTGHGLPLEIYVFSRDQVWANYEAIQADIFDHLIAAVPEFGLRIFQSPTGFDLHDLRT